MFDSPGTTQARTTALKRLSVLRPYACSWLNARMVLGVGGFSGSASSGSACVSWFARRGTVRTDQRALLRPADEGGKLRWGIVATSGRTRLAVPTENLESGKLSAGSSNMWVLPSDLTAAVLARRHVLDVCRDMPRRKVEVARLLVSELVSNAVRHGAGPVVLVVSCDGGGVRIEVHDESPDMPRIVDRQPLMEGGAGLRIVATLASSWGVDPCRDGRPGKRVWFALD